MKWPDRARRAIAFLFRPYNDIDIYVEDATSRNMYEVLINRMLPPGTRVTRIHQVGNREAVIAECERDQLPSKRRRLYLIDGDLDLLLNRAPPDLQHLYRLNVYSSENLVFSAYAILEIAYESLTNVERADVEKRLELDQFVKGLADELVPLFAWYASVYDVECTIATVGVHVMSMCTKKGRVVELDPAKVGTRIVDLKAALPDAEKQKRCETLAAELQTRNEPTVANLLRFVSGKDYLLPLLIHRLKIRADFSGTIEQLKVRLARFAEVDIDPGLLAAVTACSRSLAA